MSIPLRTLTLSLALAITSCSATGQIDCEGNFYYNANSFTAEQQGWIENTSSRWNKWVGRRVVSVKPGYARYCTIDVGSTTKPEAIGQEESRLQNIIIDIEDLKRLNILNKQAFEGVVMHEEGHALGYGHVGENGKALMAPAGAYDFTELDRIECIKKGMCTTLLPSDQAEQ